MKRKSILAIYPTEILRQPAKKVEFFDEELAKKLSLMEAIMVQTKGVGIAANQCLFSEAMFIATVAGATSEFINPELIEKSKKPIISEEGCLSIPYLTVGMLRSDSITIRYQNKAGEFLTKNFIDKDACVIQHELDHLTGRMIVDYISPVRKNIVARKLRKGKKKYGMK